MAENWWHAWPEGLTNWYRKWPYLKGVTLFQNTKTSFWISMLHSHLPHPANPIVPYINISTLSSHTPAGKVALVEKYCVSQTLWIEEGMWWTWQLSMKIHRSRAITEDMACSYIFVTLRHPLRVSFNILFRDSVLWCFFDGIPICGPPKTLTAPISQAVCIPHTAGDSQLEMRSTHSVVLAMQHSCSKKRKKKLNLNTCSFHALATNRRICSQKTGFLLNEIRTEHRIEESSKFITDSW